MIIKKVAGSDPEDRYALSYFDEAQKERMPVMFLKTNWKEVKRRIQEWVKAFVSQGD